MRARVERTAEIGKRKTDPAPSIEGTRNLHEWKQDGWLACFLDSVVERPVPIRLCEDACPCGCMEYRCTRSGEDFAVPCGIGGIDGAIFRPERLWHFGAPPPRRQSGRRSSRETSEGRVSDRRESR